MTGWPKVIARSWPGIRGLVILRGLLGIPATGYTRVILLTTYQELRPRPDPGELPNAAESPPQAGRKEECVPTRLLTIEEVAELTRRTTGAIYSERHRREGVGALGVKVGRKLVWRQDEVERWLSEHFAANRLDTEIQ